MKEDVRTAQAQEKTGIIIDYDKSGNIVGIELLDASTKMNKPGSLVYEVE